MFTYLTGKVDKLKGRGIMLLHDTHEASVHALPKFLDWLARENMRAVRQHRPPVNVIDYGVMVPKRPVTRERDSRAGRRAVRRRARLRGAPPALTERRPRRIVAGFLIRDIAPADLDDFQQRGRSPRFGEPARRSRRAGADHRTLAAVVRGGGGGRERAGRERSLLRVRGGRARQRPGRRDVDDLSPSTAAARRRTSTSTCSKRSATARRWTATSSTACCASATTTRG